MAQTNDSLRMLASPYTEAQLTEMSRNRTPYRLSLTALRALSLQKRAQALARIHADIPLLRKKKIKLVIEGCTEREATLLKHVLGYE